MNTCTRSFLSRNARRGANLGNKISCITTTSRNTRSFSTFPLTANKSSRPPVHANTTGACAGRIHPFSSSFTTQTSKPPISKRVRSIILIRHGESLGNVDEASYGTTADWLIPLTQRGRRQARAAGREINRILTTGCGGTPDHPGKVFFYVSPYLRTRQTLRGILMEVDRDQVVGIREEPRVSEQQFGNYQDLERVRDAKAERSDFGRFYYRFPNGESGFDVYERATGFISSMMRDCDQLESEGHDLEELNLVIVTHGLTLRLILMRWFQYSVHEFEESRNPDNGAVVLLKRHIDDETGRVWYELKDGARKKLHLPAYYEQSRFHITDDLTLLDTDPWDEGVGDD